MKDLEHAKDVSYSLAHDLNSTLKDKKTLEIENETLKQKVTCRGPRVAEYKKSMSSKKTIRKNVAHLNNVMNLKNSTLKQIRASKTYLMNTNHKLNIDTVMCWKKTSI